jgi:NAD(P)-dependent dehydrogenase (short-subunit alcohol dehydrogenase family)
MTSASASKSSQTPEVGVAAALTHGSGDRGPSKFRTVIDEFRLDGRVGLVTGANGGIGLESALALAELGAKIWVLDLVDCPSTEFEACAVYAKAVYRETASRRGEDPEKERMVYRRVDVTDENALQQICQEIVATDGRLDICIAAAGILPAEKSCLDVSSEEFQKVMNVK